MTPKRIFIAAPCSQELQDLVFGWREKYRQLPLRWLAGKNLHITVVSPWYEIDIEKVKLGLETIAAQFSPFEIIFDKISFGPDPRRPRLIWAMGPDSKDLITLGEKTNSMFHGTQNRRMLTHLTLARFRPEEFRSFPIQEIKEKISWGENIASVVLMESHLSPRGADYEILARSPLG